MIEMSLDYDNVPQSDFESQFRRVFEAAECRTQVELAEFLGIRQSSISDAKRRKMIPAEWLLKLFEKKGFLPAWIRTGMGDKITATSAIAGKMPPPAIKGKRGSAKDCSTDELLAEMVQRVLKVLK